MVNIFLGIWMCSYPMLAQHDWCGTMEAEQEFINAHPELKDSILLKRKDLQEYYKSFSSHKTTNVTYTIPVVFHVLHENGPENISDAQIYDAMRILNEDYSATNEDLGEIVADFQSVIGNAQIEFKLAQKDPDGNCTKGIDRIETPLTNSAQNTQEYKMNQWPRNQYLNIWVVKSIQSNGGVGIVLGRCPFPSTVNFAPWLDGVQVRHDALGSIGTATWDDATLSHEIGHWLEVYHTWGNSTAAGDSEGCNYDDGISDTPNTIGNFGGCNTSVTSCGSTDNIQNFMDYSDCSKMFTNEQIIKMQATLNAVTAQRNQIWQTNNLIATGTDGNDNLCGVDFYTNQTVACLYDTVYFFDNSYHNPSYWEWFFDNSIEPSYTDQNPKVLFTDTGLINVVLDVSNDSDSLELSMENVLKVIPIEAAAVNAQEGFEMNSPLIQSWITNNLDQDTSKWSVTSIAAFEGVQAYLINNYDNPTPGRIDNLISPLFDMSNTNEVICSFNVAYAKKEGSNQDELNVYTSSNCGQSWDLQISRKSINLISSSNTSSVFVPSDSNDWRSISFAIEEEFISDRVLIKFEFVSDGGNNLYLDNINLEGAFTSIPILVNPSNQEIITTKHATLDWKAVGNAMQYEMQMDTSLQFNSLLFKSETLDAIGFEHNNIDTEYLTDTLIAGINYYWHVRAIFDDTISDWSETWSFKTDNNTSINEAFNMYVAEMLVYPVPSSDVAHILINTKEASSYTLDLYDFKGSHIDRLFQNKTLARGVNNLVYDLNNLESGLYLLKLKTNQVEKQKKLIVIK